MPQNNRANITICTRMPLATAEKAATANNQAANREKSPNNGLRPSISLSTVAIATAELRTTLAATAVRIPRGTVRGWSSISSAEFVNVSNPTHAKKAMKEPATTPPAWARVGRNHIDKMILRGPPNPSDHYRGQTANFHGGNQAGETDRTRGSVVYLRELAPIPDAVLITGVIAAAAPSTLGDQGPAPSVRETIPRRPPRGARVAMGISTGRSCATPLRTTKTA